MGGHMEGRAISEAVVTELTDIPPQSTPEFMRSAILALHATVQSRFSSNSENSPGSTLIVADINRTTGKGILLHIGDSRGFLFRKNKWHVLTYDHIYSEFALRDGELSRNEYKTVKNTTTHRIAQALGYGSTGIIREKDGYKPLKFSPNIRLDLGNELPESFSDHADVFPFHLSCGNTLLLATDGLWSAEPEDMWYGLSARELSTQNGLEQLVQKAMEHGANDNITLVACGVFISKE